MTVLRELKPLAGAGLEPTPNSSENSQILEPRGTESGTIQGPPTPLLPPELYLVVDAWSHLPEAIRAGIGAMVRASLPGNGSGEQ